MLEMCLEAGANPKIANKLNLTPLTLAAKLAKKKVVKSVKFIIFFQINNY